MYALVVTYVSAAAPEHLRDAQIAFAEQLTAVPGFVSKTWLHEGSTLGGFYLFDSRAHAEAFIDGPLFGSLRDVPVISELTVRGFTILTDLGALTGADRPATAVTAAGTPR